MRDSKREGIDLEVLSRAVKAGIRESGLKPAEIARRAGMHPSHLSQVVSGTKGMSYRKLLALSGVIRIPQEISGMKMDEALTMLNISQVQEILVFLHSLGITKKHMDYLRSHPGQAAKHIKHTIDLLMPEEY